MVIQGRVAQVFGAFRIDENLDPVTGDNGVTLFFRVERHLVLQAGTAALSDLDAQTSRLRVAVRGEQFAEMIYRIFGDVQHLQKYQSKIENPKSKIP